MAVRDVGERPEQREGASARDVEEWRHGQIGGLREAVPDTTPEPVHHVPATEPAEEEEEEEEEEDYDDDDDVPGMVVVVVVMAVMMMMMMTIMMMTMMMMTMMMMMMMMMMMIIIIIIKAPHQMASSGKPGTLKSR
jgi:cation transport ATPase